MRALTKTRGLYERWGAAGDENRVRRGEEHEWATTELRNSLRSIEWDLEDLEDTVQIVEKNPSKFRIDSTELAVRRSFIQTTREEVKQMKEAISKPAQGERLAPGSPAGQGGGSSKHSRLSTQGGLHCEPGAAAGGDEEAGRDDGGDG